MRYEVKRILIAAAVAALLAGCNAMTEDQKTEANAQAAAYLSDNKEEIGDKAKEGTESLIDYFLTWFNGSEMETAKVNEGGLTNE